jgi:hypothetical protein
MDSMTSTSPFPTHASEQIELKQNGLQQQQLDHNIDELFRSSKYEKLSHCHSCGLGYRPCFCSYSWSINANSSSP